MGKVQEKWRSVLRSLNANRSSCLRMFGFLATLHAKLKNVHLSRV